MVFVAVEALDRLDVGPKQVKLRAGLGELVKGEVQVDGAVGLFFGRKIHLVEFVDHKKLCVRKVVAAENAFLRQHIDRDPVGLRLLARMRDDGATVPEPP